MKINSAIDLELYVDDLTPSHRDRASQDLEPHHFSSEAIIAAWYAVRVGDDYEEETEVWFHDGEKRANLTTKFKAFKHRELQKMLANRDRVGLAESDDEVSAPAKLEKGGWLVVESDEARCVLTVHLKVPVEADARDAAKNFSVDKPDVVFYVAQIRRVVTTRLERFTSETEL